MLGWASAELDPSGARSGLDTNERNHVGIYKASLIERPEARAILDETA